MTGKYIQNNFKGRRCSNLGTIKMFKCHAQDSFCLALEAVISSCS